MNPGGRMVAGVFLPADPAIDAGVGQLIGQVRGQQEVIEAKALVVGPAVAQIGPERPGRGFWVLA